MTIEDPIGTEFNFSQEEAFREAMKKRRYDEALDKISLILGNLGEDKVRGALENPSDPNQVYIKAARDLVLRYFKHYAANPTKGLKAIDTIYQMFNYRLNLVPEAQQSDTAINKALRFAYKAGIGVKNHNEAYRLGKIGDFLTKENYHELVNLAADRNNFTDAHKYALEGKLYDTENLEIKNLLGELSSVDKGLADIKKEMRDERERIGILDLKKYVPKNKELQKRKEEILELLVASIE